MTSSCHNHVISATRPHDQGLPRWLSYAKALCKTYKMDCGKLDVCNINIRHHFADKAKDFPYLWPLNLAAISVSYYKHEWTKCLDQCKLAAWHHIDLKLALYTKQQSHCMRKTWTSHDHMTKLYFETCTRAWKVVYFKTCSYRYTHSQVAKTRHEYEQTVVP